MVSVKEFWSLIGQRAVGATVVTVDGREGPAGFLGLSATHVSAEPPLMAVSVSKTTSALKDIVDRGRFAINYLPREAEDLVAIFGGSADLQGSDRFRPGEWTAFPSGCPLHARAVGALDCVLDRQIELGSTVMLIGRVVDGKVDRDGSPLILFRGKILPSGSR